VKSQAKAIDKVHLILADDHEIFRKGLEITLKRIPFIEKIHHAVNGTDVLRLVKLHPETNVIIMDIRMPSLNGIETTIEIRKSNLNVRILALSMLDDKASIVQMFKAGANGYLLKNTNKLELQEAIEQIMEGNNYFAKEVSQVLLRHDFNTPTPSKKKVMINDLTSREENILKLICQQYSTREISEILCLSEKTIEGHRKSLLDKTHSRNVAGLVWYALENGIIKEVK
jgi:DNA-binding NarL/FixJ family response regulator